MKIQSWKTSKQIAERYHLSLRTIAYLVEDRVLPVYKIGGAVRFDPVECDKAMRAFRRASLFDDCDETVTGEMIKHSRRSRRTSTSKSGNAREVKI